MAPEVLSFRDPWSQAMRLVKLGLVLTLAWAGTSGLAVEIPVEGRRFTLPEGFEIERVAASPLVERPICADFDEQGRLYVADSSGSNDKVEQQLTERPHRIVRLEDSDGDGRFDKQVVFADRMMFPEGTLWFAGSLYVAAPPSIWKLTDTDGDGVADERIEWFNGQTLTGCANDLHGPYLGPDGWIYWCKGAFAEQTHARPGRDPFVTRAAHIFRRHPEGGPIEPVMTGGMDNPVDVVFTRGGERIFTTTFLTHPGGGQRDGLIHAIYGGVYGKQHDVIEGHPRTGPLLPTLVHLGAAAPCGLVRLESDRLGEGYQENLVACLFNMRKLTRHELRSRGATFETVDHDFLVCDDLDFHPTDVLEDADGSLIVIDTGGWYKLCCPTSQLWKPDILGAIYRVRRTGGHQVADPRGKDLDWSSADNPQAWVDRLADSRPAVRRRAQHELARRGDWAVPALTRCAKEGALATERLAAVWTLTRIDSTAARDAVRAALEDADELVRHAAAQSVALWRDGGGEEPLRRMLQGPSLQNRRVAAEALGRIRAAGTVPVLMSQASEDRVLEHSVIFALIEIDDPAAVRSALVDSPAAAQRAGWIALDQMPSGNLAASEVVPLLDSDLPAVQDAAWWIASRHPEWATELGDYYRRAFASPAAMADSTSRRLFVERIVRFIQDAAIQELLAGVLEADGAPFERKVDVLDAMAASKLRELPESWSRQLGRLLVAGDATVQRKAVAAVHALSSARAADALSEPLLSVAGNEALEAAIRLEAMNAVPKERLALTAQTLAFLLDQLPADLPVRERSLAVDVLTRTSLSPEQLGQLAESLVKTGPMELKRLLDAFNGSQDESLGLQLVDVLNRAPAAAAIPPEELRSRLAKFGPAVARAGEALVARLEVSISEKQSHLDAVLSLLVDGDVRRGQRVFQSTKAACASCHAMGYLGGRVGPDLTRIGGIRTERDLLESILYPSESFVRSYEPLQIVTVEGKIYNGLVREETADEVLLALDAEKVVRIRRDEIDVRQPGKLSVMPAGLEKQLTPQDLADLVKFLKAAQ